MHESPIVIAGRDNINLADEKWERFSNELQWFLAYTHQFLKDYEQQLKNSGQWEEEMNQYKQLVETIPEVKEAFLQLRHKTVKAISHKWGDTSYSFATRTKACLDFTTIYVDFMEKVLFPQNWSYLYDEYVKKERQLSQDTP